MDPDIERNSLKFQSPEPQLEASKPSFCLEMHVHNTYRDCQIANLCFTIYDTCENKGDMVHNVYLPLSICKTVTLCHIATALVLHSQC